jgi:hypothetical protein
VTVNEKIDQLRQHIRVRGASGGAVLVVYPPEEELDFRQQYEVLIREWRAADMECVSLDLAPLPLKVLEAHRKLEKLFKLDADPRKGGLQQDIASLVEPALIELVLGTAREHPSALLCLQRTAALYPWASVSHLLERCENAVMNTIVVPFPGDERGPELHFLGAKDGYNYRAARI